jgi:hypothetical protein
MESENNCNHTSLFKDKFDYERAKEMDAEEVRKKWPRVKCDICQYICYQSMEHFICGDW